MLEQLYNKFPDLFLSSQDFSRFSMISRVGDIDFDITVRVPNFPDPKEASVEMEPAFSHLLDQCEVKELSSRSQNMIELLEGIELLLHKNENGRNNPPLLCAEEVKKTAQVLVVLDEVGWEHVTKMSDDLGQVELSCEDEKGHKHSLSVSFPPDFPSSPPTASHSLPTSVWTAPTSSSSLPLMVASWREAIASLSSAWEALHELDRLCWVVEPWPPLPYHLHRRLMVAPSVTLHLTVDPAAPLALPDIQFLGAENRVARLRKTLIENLESWAEDEPLLTNLERLLELNLPARDEEGNEEWGVECGICYSFLLGNQLPSLICEESRCCKPFHPTCLYEYFQSLPDARVNLASVHGNCPYCGKLMQCSEPKKD